MLYSIPIYAVMVEDLGERGAQYTALRLLQDEIKDSILPSNNKQQINHSVLIIVSSIVISCFMYGTYVLKNKK